MYFFVFLLAKINLLNLLTYKNVLIAVTIIIIEPSTHCSFTYLNLAIETLKQGVKSVQS